MRGSAAALVLAAFACSHGKTTSQADSGEGGMVGGGPVTITAEITNESPVVSEGLQLVAGDVVEFEIAMHLIGSRARIRGQ